ncbi:MAG: ComF family protein [Candidatus Niyogibacteria bacterium]|nr:ComF family protein [Candidatus Niyogibacteria bacterium]
MLKHFWNKTLDLLFPEKCRGCGLSGVVLCEDCRRKLRPPEIFCFACGKESDCGICAACARAYGISPIKVFWAARYSEPPIKALIHDLKYRSATKVAETLGDIFCDNTNFALQNLKNENSVIVPVPITARKLRERGFNQSEILAAALSRKSGISLATDILLKIKNTASQVAVAERAKRLENLRDSFAVPHPERISGKTAILVDDILTTGATIIECARELKKAGAKNIIALVVAH